MYGQWLRITRHLNWPKETLRMTGELKLNQPTIMDEALLRMSQDTIVKLPDDRESSLWMFNNFPLNPVSSD